MSRFAVLVLTVLVVACGGATPDERTWSRSAPARAAAAGAPVLMTGLGSHHHPIPTASPEVRKRTRDECLV